METKYTQAFAKAYRKLVTYFYDIAPKKEVCETVGNKDEATGWISWENQIFSKLDENGIISLPISQTPVTLSEFNDAAYMFISELNENVLTYSDDMNKAVLHSFFGNNYMSILTPTREMLIKAGLVDEAILLDRFLSYKNLICSLNVEIFGEAVGIEEYRKKVLSQTDTIPKKELPKKPQTKHSKQQQKSQPSRGKGRPKETLRDKMINDADGGKLQKVHTVMDGKKGKDAALIVIACMKKGWIQKPTYTQVVEEFGDIGAQQGFTRYLNEKMFSENEIEGAINSLG